MNPDPTSSRSSRPLAPASYASAATRPASAAATRTGILTKRWTTGLLTAVALAGSGCYYAHLATGQLRVLVARRPLDVILADPATPDALREQLGLVGDVRRFGADLGLAVEERYTSYVAWPGDRIVTTVVATRPGEIDPVEFWFPVVGRAPYKGFFDPGRADAEADRLRDQGHDVCLLAVPAYSSLGWFEDPVTGPMLRAGGERLVETLLHELVHATVFVPSCPDWNEGLATFFGQEAAVEFAALQGEPAAQTARRRVTEDRWVAARLLDFRSRVGALYRAAPAGPERDAARARLEAALRDELAALPLAHADSRALASGIRANDACLALRGTYDADLPRYEARLRALGGDLRRFLAEARSAGETPDPAGAFFGR